MEHWRCKGTDVGSRAVRSSQLQQYQASGKGKLGAAAFHWQAQQRNLDTVSDHLDCTFWLFCSTFLNSYTQRGPAPCRHIWMLLQNNTHAADLLLAATTSYGKRQTIKNTQSQSWDFINTRQNACMLLNMLPNIRNVRRQQKAMQGILAEAGKHFIACPLDAMLTLTLFCGILP